MLIAGIVVSVALVIFTALSCVDVTHRVVVLLVASPTALSDELPLGSTAGLRAGLVSLDVAK